MAEVRTPQNFLALKTQMSSPDIRKSFEEVLGKRAMAFTSSVLTIVGNNEYLKNADPSSVMMSAMVAATLDLPINPNLGFAAIVPYNDRNRGQIATFQIMTKGFIQLAIRSGLYARINNSVVYEGQLVREDPFTDDYEFDFKRKTSDKIVGYMAYFKLTTGFEKYFYMSVDTVQKHAKRYSQTFKRGYGVWADDFDAMALKTVIKLLLSKYGILSIEMQRAIVYDQAIVSGSLSDIDSAEIAHPDNEKQTLADDMKSRYDDIEEATIVPNKEEDMPDYAPEAQTEKTEVKASNNKLGF